MGATDFYKYQWGKTAQEAFDAARAAARWEYGHGGYTGTIAEKGEFAMIAKPDDAEPLTFARSLIDADDRRVCDKWGPAGCIDLGTDGAHPGMRNYLFFGIASD